MRRFIGEIVGAVCGFAWRTSALALVLVECVGTGGQVGPGAERTARAGHDDGAHIVVLVSVVEGGDQLVHHHAGEGIELVGPVQRDRLDSVFDLAADRLVSHRTLPVAFGASAPQLSALRDTPMSALDLPRAELQDLSRLPGRSHHIANGDQ
jgi:hypothetical protein